MRLLPLLLVLYITTGLSAQQKFIEVNVSDTVMAEATTFIYALSVSRTDAVYENTRVRNNTADPDQMMEAQYRLMHRRIDSLTNILQQKGNTLLPISPRDTFKLAPPSTLAFYSRQIRVHGLDSLAKLFTIIAKAKNIEGNITSALAGDESIYQKKLWKKLISEATEKAGAIASASNHKLGEILSVSEVKEEEKSTGWTSYPPFSALADNATSVIPGWHTTIYPPDGADGAANTTSFYPIKSTFTVRFAID